MTPCVAIPLVVTNGISWPRWSAIKISRDSFNGFSRSNLPAHTQPSQQSNAERAKVPDTTRSQNVHSRPRYALFQHFRPSYAIFGSALAQPFERKISLSRPTYGVFGGQFMPLVTVVLPNNFPSIYPLASVGPCSPRQNRAEAAALFAASHSPLLWYTPRFPTASIVLYYT